MNFKIAQTTLGTLLISSWIVGCGGSGSDTTSTPAPTPVLSANQQAYEDLALGSGLYTLEWSLPVSAPPNTSSYYWTSIKFSLSASPLTAGPQKVTDATAANMTSTLPIQLGSVSRILKNGTILLVPADMQTKVVSYSGGDVYTDYLATDNTTVAYSVYYTNITSTPLTGLVTAASADFMNHHNVIFTNPNILNNTASFTSGSKYITYTSINKGDRYLAYDCGTTTKDANISACKTGTTLSAALTAGIASSSDATTYYLANGTLSTIGGIPVWVSNTARSESSTGTATPLYRIYFQMNGNVYTGSLIKDGAAMGATAYTPSGSSAKTYLTTNIRLNKAARDSIAAAAKM